VGLKVAPEIARQLARLVHGLQHRAVRPVAAADIHLTLVPPWKEASIPETIEKLRLVTDGFVAFSLQFRRVGYGPQPKRPRLVWVECAVTEELVALRAALLDIFQQADERPFRPHATLARIRGSGAAIARKHPIEQELSLEQPVETIELFQSPPPGGSGYQVLASIPLRTNSNLAPSPGGRSGALQERGLGPNSRLGTPDRQIDLAQGADRPCRQNAAFLAQQIRGDGMQDLNQALQATQEWIDALMQRLAWRDRERVCQALLSTLHALRDALARNEAVYLGAQLPTLLRGFYYEGWHPDRRVPVKSRSAFLERIHDGLHRDPGVDADEVAHAVFALLAARLSEAELEDAKAATPKPLHGFWPS